MSSCGTSTSRGRRQRHGWSKILTRWVVRFGLLVEEGPRPALCKPTSMPCRCLQLEMILQAHEYEGAQGMRLQEFFDSTAGKWRTELGKSWAEEIYTRRRAAAADKGQAG